MIAQQREVLLDDFTTSSKYNWQEGSTSTQQKKVTNGYYNIINNSENSITWNSVPAKIHKNKDFSIETDVALYQNSRGEALLIFGENPETGNFYFYQIRDIKNAYPIYIGKRENGEWKGTWMNSKTNPLKKMNRLTVKRIDDKIYYLLNGIIIHTDKFEPFYGTNIGLGAGGPQHAVFDYLLVIEN